MSKHPLGFAEGRKGRKRVTKPGNPHIEGTPGREGEEPGLVTALAWLTSRQAGNMTPRDAFPNA